MKNIYLSIMLMMLTLISSCENDDEGTLVAPVGFTVAITPSINQAKLTSENSAEFTIVFSEAIDPATFTASDITLSGSRGIVTIASTSTDNITWIATITEMTNGDVVAASLRADVVNSATGIGNKASFFTNEVVTYSRVTATIDQSVTQLDPTNLGTAKFTIVFSEAIDPATFSVDDITLSGTTGTIVTAPSSTDNITWDFTVTSIANLDTVVATLAENVVMTTTGIINEASTSIDNMVTYDDSVIILVDVTLDQSANQMDPTDVDSIEFTVIFGEAIDPTTFTASDITLSGTTGTVTTDPTSTDNVVWSFTVSGMTEVDKVTAELMEGVVTNMFGAPNAASTSTDNAVRYTTDIACGVNAYVWDGTLTHDAGATERFPSGPPFDVTGVVTSCGELAISSTVSSFSDLDPALLFCQPGNTYTLNIVLTPASSGATNGTVTIPRQGFENCSEFSENEAEGTGTYDETTGIITLELTKLFGGSPDPAQTIILSTK